MWWWHTSGIALQEDGEEGCMGCNDLHHLPPPYSSPWFAWPEVEAAVHRCGTHHPPVLTVANQQCFHQLWPLLFHLSLHVLVDPELINNPTRINVVLKLKHWHFPLLLFIFHFCTKSPGAWRALHSAEFQHHLLVFPKSFNKELKHAERQTAGLLVLVLSFPTDQSRL